MKFKNALITTVGLVVAAIIGNGVYQGIQYNNAAKEHSAVTCEIRETTSKIAEETELLKNTKELYKTEFVREYIRNPSETAANLCMFAGQIIASTPNSIKALSEKKYVLESKADSLSACMEQYSNRMILGLHMPAPQHIVTKAGM